MRDSLTVVSAILLRDGPYCYLCNESQDAWPDDPFEIEHVVPRSAGGSGDLDNIANLKLAHRSCNRQKGTNAVVPKVG